MEPNQTARPSAGSVDINPCVLNLEQVPPAHLPWGRSTATAHRIRSLGGARSIPRRTHRVARRRPGPHEPDRATPQLRRAKAHGAAAASTARSSHCPRTEPVRGARALRTRAGHRRRTTGRLRERASRPSLLIIEVADSSLDSDRGAKLQVYASSGVPEYWIVNPRERCIEVHTAPMGRAYTSVARV